MLLISIIFILFFGQGFDSLIIPYSKLFAGFSPSLLAIFFYITLGKILNKTRISSYIINFLKELFSRIYKRGTLGLITIIACSVTGALTGSAVGTTTAIGGMMIPQMKKYNYDNKYLVALLSYSGILGTLIPPSISGLIFAVVVRLPVLDVWVTVGGVGILFAITLLIANYITSSKRNYEYHSETEITGNNLLQSFIAALYPLLIPLGILGSIYGGIATATEAGVIGILFTMILGVFYYKTLTSPAEIIKLFYESALQTAVIMFLICTSFAFSHILTITGVTKSLAQIIFVITDNKYIILLLTELLILFLGCFLDDTAIMILLSPIAYAILIPLGIHPLHFSAIFVFAGIVGMVTPPVGIVIYASLSVVGSKMEFDIVKEVFLFIIPAIIILIIITFFPELVLFLPRILNLA
jgi:C4-dicarboxylate transporter DctM subunit